VLKLNGDKSAANTILHQIIVNFLKEVEKDKEIPDKVVTNLQNLWKNGDLSSKEKILESIRMEDSNED
jgi:hypothetical protein